MIQAEHILQTQLKKWVRNAVTAEHLFLAFDSAGKATMNQRARAASRGVLTGTPDTLLRVRGIIPIWCELKRPGGKPTDAQKAVGSRLLALGDDWFWADSIVVYHHWLASRAVPMVPHAKTLAESADATVALMVERAKARRPGAGVKKTAPRFTAGKGVAKRAKIRSIIL